MDQQCWTAAMGEASVVVTMALELYRSCITCVNTTPS